jgi:hypothetical protein
MVFASCGGKRMAKKRDRKEPENSEGTSFAGTQEHHPGEGDIEAWEDEETAPDIFASASDEDRMPAGGGHTQRQDEEPAGTDRPGLGRR